MDIAFLASGPDMLPQAVGALVTLLGVAVVLVNGPSNLARRARVADPGRQAPIQES
jgi:hypothetical protein